MVHFNGCTLLFCGLGHRIFKSTGRPSPIMKGHRIIGPTTILLGLANVFGGLAFAGAPARSMIVFGVALLVMLAVLAVTMFFNKRRVSRKGAYHTPAAHNFREGQMEPMYPPTPYQPYHANESTADIPLNSYSPAPPPVYR